MNDQEWTRINDHWIMKDEEWKGSMINEEGTSINDH